MTAPKEEEKTPQGSRTISLADHNISACEEAKVNNLFSWTPAPTLWTETSASEELFYSQHVLSTNLNLVQTSTQFIHSRIQKKWRPLEAGSKELFPLFLTEKPPLLGGNLWAQILRHFAEEQD